MGHMEAMTSPDAQVARPSPRLRGRTHDPDHEHAPLRPTPVGGGPALPRLAGDADGAATLHAMAEVSGGADGVCFDNRCRRADGSSCSLSWSVWADAEHQVLYRSVRDVTELREHSDVVTKILAELERSNTKLAHVAYVALHDLVQPLTTQRRRDDVKLCR